MNIFKHIASLLLVASAAFTALADLNGSGYYRLQNYRSNRWVSMIDDKGKKDMGSTSVDLQALRTQMDFDVVVSDPASIIYLTPVGNQYNITAQGTNLHNLYGYYITIANAGSANGQKLYYAKGTESGVEKYISDGGYNLQKDIAYCVTSGSGDWRKWYIWPMTDTGANYFGVLPTVSAGDKHYATMLGSFSFKPFSEGVKAYVIKEKGVNVAYAEEATGILPPSTPVLLECASTQPTDNRLTIGGDGPAVGTNLMKGAYFCATTQSNHLNYVKYDPATMRVIGTMDDGSLGFVKDNSLEYIPANTCWLTVPAWYPDKIKVVFSSEEFTASVDGINADSELQDVYTLQGLKVLSKATSSQISSLPHGIYIINGKKVRL